MIYKLVDEIRNLINTPRKQYELLSDSFSWNMLCASMDTIEDSELAIDNYKKLPPFDGFTGGYLYIYGLLQALFLQQDAVNHLSQALFNENIDYKKNYPEIYKIRELRNNAIGHPTNRNNGQSFCVISRISINNNGFSLCHYFPNRDSKFEDVDINLVITTQSSLLRTILERIINELKMEENDHRIKFSAQKLSSIVTNTLDYHITKLYEGIHSPDYNKSNLVKINIDMLNRVLNDIEKSIEERFNSINAIDELKRLIPKLKFILNHLSELLNDNQYHQNIATEVYVDSFQKEFDLLKVILKEIDDEYNKSV